jgi:hypothetical protein
MMTRAGATVGRCGASHDAPLVASRHARVLALPGGVAMMAAIVAAQGE